MAKERNLPSKTTLTTSDFIRVVGSDNASYKQGVASVASTVLSAQPTGGSYTGSIKDWAFGTNGQGIVATSANTTDLPSTVSNKYGVAWVKAFISGNNHWINLYWSPTNSADIYICSNTDNGNTWTDWEKLPTRAEIDALNSNIGACSIKKFTNSSAGGTAEVPLTATGIIFVLSVMRTSNTDVSQEGYGLIKCYNNNAYLTKVVGLSGFSVTMSNGNAVITMTPYTNVMLICYS